ncbi:MAG: FkbM family methyltransferase, partial [Methanocorpusculum sp.]|nr:FkbM family methyltransferase [Methanocorpusculum sp.]
MMGFPENISGFHCADVGKKFNVCVLPDVVQILLLSLSFSFYVSLWKYFTTGYILTEKDSMRFYQKLIQNRRKGGSIYLARQHTEECRRRFPDNSFFRDECQYWRYVYWLTGEVTRRLGMDARREQRMSQSISEICGYSPEDSSVRIGGMHLFIDDPALCRIIAFEYPDICDQDVYYQNQYPKYRLEPEKRDLLTCFCGGEGPYETESVQLCPDDVVVDCGANIGMFSILAVQRGAKTVYAFDPQKRTLKLLDQNITANGCEGKIIPVPFGLSDRNCSLSFTESEGTIGSRISREGDAATTTIECT